LTSGLDTSLRLEDRRSVSAFLALPTAFFKSHDLPPHTIT
jgi:hypothetical protein